MKKTFFTIVIMSIFVFRMEAQMSYDRTPDSPLYEILSILESKNDIVFSYNDANIKDQTASIPKGSYTLQQILQEVCNQSKLEFEFVDSRYILLTPKKTLNKPTVICGYIKDQTTKEDISYASVYTSDKLVGVESNDKGYFEITVPANKPTVQISFLGYKTFDINVEKVKEGVCKTYYLD